MKSINLVATTRRFRVARPTAVRDTNGAAPAATPFTYSTAEVGLVWGLSRRERLCFRYRTVEEVTVAIEASIESLSSELQNETLEDILARNTIDLLALTFRTHVLCRH